MEFSVVSTNKVGNFYVASFQRQFLINKEECGESVGICCDLGRRIEHLNQTYILTCSTEEDTNKQVNAIHNRSFEAIVPLLFVCIIIVIIIILGCFKSLKKKLTSLRKTWSVKLCVLVCYGIFYGYNLSFFNQPLELTRAYYLGILEERSENSSIYVDWILATLVSLFFICAFFGSILYAWLRYSNVLVQRKSSIWIIHLFMLISGLLGVVSVDVKSYQCVLISRAINGLSYGFGINYLHHHSEMQPNDLRVANILYQLSASVGILLANVVGFPNLMGTKEQLSCLFAVNVVLASGCLFGTYFLHEKRSEDEIIIDPKLFWKQLKHQITLKYGLFIACFLTVICQLTGINFIMGYSSSIFAALGQEINEIGISVFGISALYVILNIVAIFLMHNFERRIILIILTVIMFVCLLVVTYLLNISQHHRTDVEVLAGITAVTLFVISFALGLGPIRYLITEKLSPAEQITQVSLVTRTISWLLTFIIMLVFIPFLKCLQGYMFVPSIVFIFLGLIMISQIPETKGKDREEIQKSLPKFCCSRENRIEEVELTNF